MNGRALWLYCRPAMAGPTLARVAVANSAPRSTGQLWRSSSRCVVGRQLSEGEVFVVELPPGQSRFQQGRFCCGGEAR
jgi:hypothetical protein